MEATEKAIRKMMRVANRIESDDSLPNEGIYGAEWLYHDAADSIAGVFDRMTPDQQRFAQQQSQRAADALDVRARTI